MTGRSHGAAALTSLALLALTWIAPTRAAAQASEAQVKAAFLYNFARFVEWPASPGGPAVARLCVLGADPFGADLTALDGRPAGAATVRVRRIVRTQEIAGCDMVFLPATEAASMSAFLAATRGRRVLTVGETPGASERGMVINFYLEQKRVRFEINIDAAQRTGLNISSQLLRLARITHDRTGADD